MAPPGKHRDTILAAAARLFRRHGYSGTGLAEILAESGAPKGSLYYHFPGGKTEIAAAAVGYAGALVTSSLEALARKHDTPQALLRAYAAQLAVWMEQSNWQAGCPIATVLLETAPVEIQITEAGNRAFADWARVFMQALTAQGVEPERARRLSRMAIISIEGALIMARVEQSAEPILSMAEEVAEMISAERKAG